MCILQPIIQWTHAGCKVVFSCEIAYASFIRFIYCTCWSSSILGLLAALYGNDLRGRAFLTAAGMPARLHAFDFFISFFFALSGVLLGDMLWYCTGRNLKSRYPHHRISLFVIQRVKKYLPSIERNSFHVIFLSKFLYGLNHSTLVVLGFLKVPFGRFIRIQFVTSLTRSLIFMTIGYVFGSLAITFTHRLRHFIFLAFFR